MKYLVYPQMKDSGIEWLGEIPEHWEVKKIKWISRVVRGQSPRPIDDPRYFDDNGNFNWVRISDVTKSDMYLKETEQTLSKLGSSLSVKLNPGEIFLSIAASVGKPCITKIKCCIHDGFVYFPDIKESKKFIFYIFDAGECYKGLGKLGTQLNLNSDIVGSIKIGFPPINEQKAIASFLDKETDRIDQLIDKKEQLIKLLQEKRQVLISKAVTKGLNPDVMMKDSGIEWLGEIPEHWEVSSIKYLLTFLDNKRIPISSEERGKMNNKEYPYYGASGVIDYVNDYLFDETLILLGEDGANLESRSTRLAFLASGKYWVNNHAHILRPKEGNIEYFADLLESLDYRIYLTGSAQPKLTQDNLANIKIPNPPLKEQQQIIAYLDKETSKIDNLIEKVTQQISNLKEYRQALISNAVTGKIDVREVNQDE